MSPSKYSQFSRNLLGQSKSDQIILGGIYFYFYNLSKWNIHSLCSFKCRLIFDISRFASILNFIWSNEHTQRSTQKVEIERDSREEKSISLCHDTLIYSNSFSSLLALYSENLFYIILILFLPPTCVSLSLFLLSYIKKIILPEMLTLTKCDKQCRFVRFQAHFR